MDFSDASPYIAQYEREGGEQTRKEIHAPHYPAKQVQLGLKIASALVAMGYELQGVPGFYKFGNAWCFYAQPGILIPTRNMKGEIVVWQVRKKYGSSKYITCHNSNLPGAVTASVVRCHFPLHNAPLASKPTVIFTEGPLKADVALCLCGNPVFFAAILGIAQKEDLLRHIEDFRSAGIETIQNGFDMDKITNPNVIDGSVALMNEIQMRGMTVQQLYWGERYAQYKLMSLIFIARTRNVLLPEDLQTLNIFDQLKTVSLALRSAGIEACKRGTNKDKVSWYWDPETKGIDDYYLSLR
jgi:hypothetical protein